MTIVFQKFQGTGNDFIIIDNRNNHFPQTNTPLIAKLCNRKFGIGADGLILLENDATTDFKMVYFNADGNQSTMCGNGGRCLVAFAKKNNIINNHTTFMAIDGLHYATIDAENTVSLQMKDVDYVLVKPDYVFANTGSPHHVMLVDDLKNYAVKTIGGQIRNSDLYGSEGCNINFVNQKNETEFDVRTYERGVEDETLSCGTGATAVAIAMFATQKCLSTEIKINVEGGKLAITFDEKEGVFTNIFLKGPATFVFDGQIII